jgi:hypothetical protein
MGYLIAAILVLLLLAGFITFFVLNATRRSGSAGPRDPGAEGSPAGIAAPDETPLGTTSEHSGAGAEGGRSARRETGREAGREPERRDTRPESERLANRPR